ncbi:MULTISPECIES: hypothetical protein [unclassified Clostridium]|uniref:hypothetical protein n=1 Tax=unclassified Clostridium TaxID=2614128 RepID=UPI00029849EB|nr:MULTISPECIES: hypothetical protein [unclassified Clostridium]EKQ51920.1 MAG: hypothetical protein A370_04489 [Clostridium sp. Maddingley MBC34-26]
MATYFEFRSIAELLDDNCDFDSEQKELIQNTSCKCQECMLAGVLAGLEEILLEYAKQIQEWQAKLLECPGVATGGTAAKISLGVSSEEFELVGGSLDYAGLGLPGGEKAGGVPKKAGGAAGALPHTSGSNALGGAGHP